MTERYARDPDPGLIDRLGELLFPWLYPEVRACGPCVDHDHQAAKSEPELEAGL